MTRRIPHAETEVRQAFQKLTKRSDVLTTGTAGQVLIGQGVGVIPAWTTDLTALTSLTVDNITIDAATILSDSGAISFGNENLTTTGTIAGINVTSGDAPGHTHSDIVATDKLVAVDSGATAGYLGAAAGDGVLRTGAPLTYTYADGGDFITLDVDETAIDHDVLTNTHDLTDDIDHGSIAGIIDDDHAIYLLADGSRDLTGNMLVDAGITIDGRDISADGAALDTIDWLTVGTGLDLTGTTISTEDTEIVHADLSGYVADEHVAHTGVTITTGSGLTGGGDISTDRTFALDINGLAADTIVADDSIPFYDTTGGANDKTTFASFEAALDHGNLIGLGDDDHTIYLLADGTRELTGNLTVSDGIWIGGGAAAERIIFDFTGGDLAIMPLGTSFACGTLTPSARMHFKSADIDALKLQRNSVTAGHSVRINFGISTNDNIDQGYIGAVRVDTANINLVFYTGTTATETMTLYATGNVQLSSGNLSIGAGISPHYPLTVDGGIGGIEKSADPAEPAEGEFVIWMSDGSGKGDDGDVMIASQAGGQTNVGTLLDHSGGAAW